MSPTCSEIIKFQATSLHNVQKELRAGREFEKRCGHRLPRNFIITKKKKFILTSWREKKAHQRRAVQNRLGTKPGENSDVPSHPLLLPLFSKSYPSPRVALGVSVSIITGRSFRSHPRRKTPALARPRASTSRGAFLSFLT